MTKERQPACARQGTASSRRRNPKGAPPRAKWYTLVLIAMPCAAHANGAQLAQLYGLADAYVGVTHLSGQRSAAGVESGGMQTSFWGMTGSEDLGGGIKANFRLEGFFLADTGANGRAPTDGLFARNAYVGLENGFGEVRLGRLANPTYLATALFDAFSGSTKFSPLENVLWTPQQGRYIAGDTAWNNALGYYSPEFAGLSFRGLYSLGEQSGTNSQNNAVGMLLYERGPFSATFAIQRTRVGPGLPAGSWAQTAMVGGLSYDFKTIRLMTEYAHTSTSGASTSTDTLQVGAQIPLGSGRLLASAVSSRVRSDAMPDYRRHGLAGGYDYALSKRTDLYILTMFDKVTGKGSGTSLALGMREKF
ncbi:MULTISPECIES: porin [Cupriavidus]|uniref:Porin, Gram-negative type n=1 Tax=Cupriavidus pinatubonensis (strain JMP 134 / LMG 1197) TaxID=264198 RepID=Q470M3_CUPPJ|nr:MULTISPECIES: porin [Cupriavidus]